MIAHLEARLRQTARQRTIFSAAAAPFPLLSTTQELILAYTKGGKAVGVRDVADDNLVRLAALRKLEDGPHRSFLAVLFELAESHLGRGVPGEYDGAYFRLLKLPEPSIRYEERGETRAPFVLHGGD